MNLENRFQRLLHKLLCLVLIFFLTLSPQRATFVLAEGEDTGVTTTTSEVTPTDVPTETTALETVEADPTATPTPEVSVENSADVVSDIDSEANTGGNEIISPSPTPSPTVTVEPSVEEAQTDGQSGSTGGSEETSAPPTESQDTEEELSPTPTPEITTGDSISVVGVDNEINCTMVNSQVISSTTNITSPGSGDIDLTSEEALASYPSDEESDPGSSSVDVTVDNGVTTVTTEVTSEANSGGNSIEGDGSITTGDAISVVSVVNNVNSTYVDSTLEIFTVNIFDVYSGDIILPDYGVDLDGCCGGSVDIDNSATVETTVDSLANSGDNTIITDEGGEITTGDAKSSVNVLNLVNQTFIDTFFQKVFISIFGGWNGTFRGVNGEEIAVPSGCPGCVSDVTIDNISYVFTNISSTANSGGNKIDGGSGEISTGDAQSSVNVVNIVDSTFIRSFGRITFINIFGELTGDIGGESTFPSPTPTPDPESESEQAPAADDPTPPKKDIGGQLEVALTHNVGEYVLPGDTVTFFATLKNTGGGRVYDTVLHISLVKDGVNTGEIEYKIGTIKGFGTAKLTTGIVLSPEALGGGYVAKATLTGIVGPDDHEVGATSEALFNIFGKILQYAEGIIPEVKAEEIGEVLAAAGDETLKNSSLESRMRQIFWISLVAVFILQGYKRRRALAGVVSQIKNSLVLKNK